MATLSISERYRPAYLSAGKEWIVIYWVRHPDTDKWTRVKQKLNHIRDQESRKVYARNRIRELNLKLATGWNPLVDQQAPKSQITVAKAMDAFLETKLKEEIATDSERSYRSLLGIFRTWLTSQRLVNTAVGALTEDHAIAFMDHAFATRNISKRTFCNYKAFYGTLALWWVRHKYIRTNVFAAVERKRYNKNKKNRRPLTDVERRQVRAYLQEHHPRFLAFSLLVFHCALRPKEAFMLKPQHIDLRRQVVHITEEIAKTDNERHPAIPNVLIDELRALGVEDQDPSHYLFSDKFLPGPKLKRSTYSGKWWLKVRRALNLPMECKHYSLRDTAVLQLARDQVSRVDSMNHFDHHSSDMHDIYGRAWSEQGNQEVREKMSAF